MINYCFCEATNVQMRWLGRDSVQVKTLYFLIVHLWNYVCFYFMITMVYIMRGLVLLMMFLSCSMLFDFYQKKKKKFIWACIRDLLDYLVFNFSLFILCFGHKIWLFLENKRHNVNFVHKKYMCTFYLYFGIYRGGSEW